MSLDNRKQQYIPCHQGEKLRIAVIYQVASFWPSIESFYDECVSDIEVEIRIFFIGGVSVEKAQIQGSDIFLQERGIPYVDYSEKVISDYMPHVALYQVPYDVGYRNPDALAIHLKRMGIRIAYIPYGIEIADTEDARLQHFHTFVINNAWRIYTFSARMREDYMHYCPNRHAVRAFGLPKFDAIARRESVVSEEVRRTAGGRRVILWKLHFPKLIYEGNNRKQVTPQLEEYRKFAEQIEQYQEAFFVVMPHPMFFSETIDPYLGAEGRKLLELLETRKNVSIDRSQDYRTALYSADAIIIDRSAVMVEAGFLDVPVLYMKNRDYEEPLTRAVKMLVDSYEQGTACEDMCRFVEMLDQTGTAIVHRIKEARQAAVPYEIGKSGKLILEDMKESVRQEHDNKIKIAFFSASFTCEHYINELEIRSNADFEIVCLSDNDEQKWGTRRAGYEVIAPEELIYQELDLIVITSEHYYVPMKKQLVYELNLAEDKIIPLDLFAEEYVQRYYS